jgi:hypothetical protein
MTLDIWTKPSGYDIGSFNDQITLVIDLPVTNDTGVTYGIIAGALPEGLYINGNQITGIANIVKTDSIYKFCIRASHDSQTADRTFYLTITSKNPLSFVTPSGRLHCGINQQLFAIDNTNVNFQILVESDIPNDIVTFRLESGSLPGGLSLSTDGIISGFLSKLSTDELDHEYQESQFIIRASNQAYSITQSFIFIVVGPYYLTADNTLMHTGTSIFTADVTNIRPVQWITNPYLGPYRYDNYLTVEFETYESDSILYSLDINQPIPPGTTLTDGILSGYIPSQTTYNTAYDFEIAAIRTNNVSGESITNKRTFSIDIIGKFDDTLEWLTPTNAGTITEGIPVNLSIIAVSSLSNSNLIYEIIDGILPNGVTMGTDGIITGVHFSSASDDFIDYYTFTVRVSNQYSGIFSDSITHYGVFEKIFTITVIQSEKMYSNIIVKPYLEIEQRERWGSFITNQEIFPLSMMYRPYDTNFGIQKQLEMLIFPGIDTSSIETFVNAANLNNAKKRFQFGSITSAKAIDQTTFAELYEVVYINMLDPLEPNGEHLPLSINNEYIGTYYPSSVTLWRERLVTVTDVDSGTVLSTNIEFVPLWMRSIQPSDRSRIGFTLAVPLCYCKVGTSSQILRNIELSGINLSSFDYTVDRYIVNDFINPQYVVFNH